MPRFSVQIISLMNSPRGPSLTVSGTDWEGDAENEHAAITEAYKQWDEERGGGRRPGGTIVHAPERQNDRRARVGGALLRRARRVAEVSAHTGLPVAVPRLHCPEPSSCSPWPRPTRRGGSRRQPAG